MKKIIKLIKKGEQKSPSHLEELLQDAKPFKYTPSTQNTLKKLCEFNENNQFKSICSPTTIKLSPTPIKLSPTKLSPKSLPENNVATQKGTLLENLIVPFQKIVTSNRITVKKVMSPQNNEVPTKSNTPQKGLTKLNEKRHIPLSVSDQGATDSKKLVVKKSINNNSFNFLPHLPYSSLFDENIPEDIIGSFSSGHTPLSIELVDHQLDQYRVLWKALPQNSLNKIEITPLSSIFKLDVIKQNALDVYVRFLEKQFEEYQKKQLEEKLNSKRENIHKKIFIDSERFAEISQSRNHTCLPDQVPEQNESYFGQRSSPNEFIKTRSIQDIPEITFRKDRDLIKNSVEENMSKFSSSKDEEVFFLDHKDLINNPILKDKDSKKGELIWKSDHAYTNGHLLEEEFTQTKHILEDHSVKMKHVPSEDFQQHITNNLFTSEMNPEQQNENEKDVSSLSSSQSDECKDTVVFEIRQYSPSPAAPEESDQKFSRQDVDICVEEMDKNDKKIQNGEQMKEDHSLQYGEQMKDADSQQKDGKMKEDDSSFKNGEDDFQQKDAQMQMEIEDQDSKQQQSSEIHEETQQIPIHQQEQQQKCVNDYQDDQVKQPDYSEQPSINEEDNIKQIPKNADDILEQVSEKAQVEQSGQNEAQEHHEISEVPKIINEEEESVATQRKTIKIDLNTYEDEEYEEEEKEQKSNVEKTSDLNNRNRVEALLQVISETGDDSESDKSSPIFLLGSNPTIKLECRKIIFEQQTPVIQPKQVQQQQYTLVNRQIGAARKSAPINSKRMLKFSTDDGEVNSDFEDDSNVDQICQQNDEDLFDHSSSDSQERHQSLQRYQSLLLNNNSKASSLNGSIGRFKGKTLQNVHS